MWQRIVLAFQYFVFGGVLFWARFVCGAVTYMLQCYMCVLRHCKSEHSNLQCHECYSHWTRCATECCRRLALYSRLVPQRLHVLTDSWMTARRTSPWRLSLCLYKFWLFGEAKFLKRRVCRGSEGLTRYTSVSVKWWPCSLFTTRNSQSNGMLMSVKKSSILEKFWFRKSSHLAPDKVFFDTWI